jgi:citrate lyase subunit beta/citryl-CoA lyase
MSTAIRPRRSVLYMPGTNARALVKARQLPADGLILDLEDAVAPESKSLARDAVCTAVSVGGYGAREVVIRVNGLDTPWGEADIAAAVAAGPDAILLPKVSSRDTVRHAVAALDAAGAAPEMQLWIMAETARGVLDLDSIVADQPRLSVVVMGTSDLARELRVSSGGDRSGLVHALRQCVLAARAHGLDIIDGVHVTLSDAGGLRLACLQGRAMGFDGKSLIHPAQIETANEVFSVSTAEADAAREIVAAWDAARASGAGITVVNGQLVEELHMREAERTLAIYAATREAQQNA